jgi:hypothetical protein
MAATYFIENKGFFPRRRIAREAGHGSSCRASGNNCRAFTDH